MHDGAKFIGYLLLAGCLFAGPCAGLAQTIERPGDPQVSNGISATDFSIPVQIVEDPERTEAAKRERQEDVQRDMDNLVAQQGVDQSTKNIVGLTILQTILALLGTLALLYSLHLNRKATRAAVSAADAAREALGAERAWMSHFKCHNCFLDNFEGVFGAQSFGVIVAWKNTGRTPATNVSVSVDHALVPVTTLAPVFGNIENNQDNSAVVGPEIDVNTNIIMLTINEYDLVKQGALDFYIYCRIDYRDTFRPDVPRHSEMCYKVAFNGQVMQDGVVLPRVSYRATGLQNTAV